MVQCIGQDRDHVEHERISRMLLESEDIKRFQLGFEKASLCVLFPYEWRRHDEMLSKFDRVPSPDKTRFYEPQSIPLDTKNFRQRIFQVYPGYNARVIFRPLLEYRK